MNQHLIIFARSPFNGPVKTRLAKDIGQEAARGVYARLLYDLLFRCLATPSDEVEIILSLANPQHQAHFKAAFPELTIAGQPPGDLGDRMQTALQARFAAGAEKAILIGSDIPGITWPLIRQAFTAITQERVVLGPSIDGGFYLIGMPASPRTFFEAIAWSTDRVAQQVITNIQKHQLQVELLPTLPDIDVKSDWEDWQTNQMG
jgi:hypothetical protein